MKRCTSELSNYVERFIAVVPCGRHNGISMQALSSYFKLDPRDIRELATMAIWQGYPIFGDSFGYWTPASAEEFRIGMRLQDARAKSSAIKRNALKAIGVREGWLAQ